MADSGWTLVSSGRDLCREAPQAFQPRWEQGIGAKIFYGAQKCFKVHYRTQRDTHV